MPFSAVGSIILGTSASFTISPQNLGDLILLEIIEFSHTVFCTGVSGGGCTWTQISAEYPGAGLTNVGFSAVVFAGKVTATGSATVTLSFNGTPSTIRAAGQEFSSTVGNWSYDTQGFLDTTDGTSQYPSLTPVGADELYFGYFTDSGSGTNGSASGYIYGQDSHGNNWLYNSDCGSSTQAPTSGDSGNQFGLAVLLRETSTPSSFSPVGGWQFIEPVTGNTTLNTVNVGDLVLAVVLTTPSTSYCTRIAGGGVGTWTQVGSLVQGSTNDWAGVAFMGTVTSTGTVTCTLSYNGTPSAEHSRFQEFKVSGGNWALDTWGDIDNSGSDDWVSLSASSREELYYGYATDTGSSTAGSQPGFVYEIDGDGNGIAYNCDCGPGAVQAVWGDTGQAFGIMALIKEVMPVAPGSGLLMASFP